MLWSVSAIGLLVLLASVAKKRFQHNADACTRRPNDDSPCSLIVVLGCPPPSADPAHPLSSEQQQALDRGLALQQPVAQRSSSGWRGWARRW